MTKYLSHTTPLNFISRYNFTVGLNSMHLEKYNELFLEPIFLNLCNDLNIHPGKFEYLQCEDLITEKEFENINMELAKPYFYEKIFPLIKKNSYGKIDNKALFAFTYDMDLTPISKGSSRYGVINLGNKPVFYYCYIDLQKAIRFVKSLE